MRGPVLFGYSLGAVLTERRLHEQGETRITAFTGLLLLLMALAGILFPLAITIPLAVLCASLSLSLLIRALNLYLQSRRSRAASRREDT